MAEDYHLPICTHCYAVRVEPQRRYMPRPTCMQCGEIIAKQRKSITDPDYLKQLNPKRTQ